MKPYRNIYDMVFFAKMNFRFDVELPSQNPLNRLRFPDNLFLS